MKNRIKLAPISISDYFKYINSTSGKVMPVAKLELSKYLTIFEIQFKTIKATSIQRGDEPIGVATHLHICLNSVTSYPSFKKYS